MHLVGQVKVLLGVEPFPRSDERSFIPDDYRAAEEIPIRFSLDYFSKVMARFQQHHTSVCEAYNTSCKGTLCRNRGQGSPGACITAMRTTTENLETVDSTEGYRCLGRKQERQKAEISVDLQCLTEASDEEEMNRVPRHAECKFKGITIVKTSSNGKDAVKLAKQRVEAWVDQQCVTEISDDDDQNICSENASPASLIGYEGKISFSAQETRGVVGGMGVDLNCDTEGSDEEMTGQTNSAGSVFHRMRKVRNSSHSLGDSLGSDSSWLKLSLSDRELPLGNGKETHNAADQTAEEWVDLQCPAKFSEDEELNGVGQRCKGKNRIRTSSSSLGDSLGSNSSWQKLSLCDVALQINDSNHAGSLAKQRVVVEVDPQSTTQASDEADQSDLRNSAVCRPIPVHRTYIGLHNQPLDQTFLATNTSPGNKNTRPWCVSGEDLSFQLVDSEVAVIRTDTPAGPSAADVSLTCDNQLPEPHDVDPLADTEEYGLEYFEMPPESIHKPLGHYPVNSSSNYKESHAPGTEIRKMGDPVQSRSVGVMENKKELVDLGKLHLDRDSCLSQSNQSHDQCIANCMLGCAGTEHLPKLTVQDYRALLSGVCHKCLLNRLSIKKTFRLRKHRRAYSALLLKYSKVSDRWMSQETKVYIGEPLGKKGNQRTAFWVHFLHQEETLSSKHLEEMCGSKFSVTLVRHTNLKKQSITT
ncbi:hypothetical protein JZ751_006911 [Albula glossodonta]|uniref:Uncharacterized protein n=1 Tax=Albula glossodonta TaxID=121402 RepID=A0A8T2P465_9TELE|nr:hypothetical protein JZ751_006911 [Albula glossodonta]